MLPPTPRPTRPAAQLTCQPLGQDKPSHGLSHAVPAPGTPRLQTRPFAPWSRASQRQPISGRAVGLCQGLPLDHARSLSHQAGLDGAVGQDLACTRSSPPRAMELGLGSCAALKRHSLRAFSSSFSFFSSFSTMFFRRFLRCLLMFSSR